MAIGELMVSLGSVSLVYYTFWMIIMVLTIQPFVDKSYWLHDWFPERFWGVLIPSALLVLLVSFVGTFIGLIFMKSSLKQAKG